MNLHKDPRAYIWLHLRKRIQKFQYSISNCFTWIICSSMGIKVGKGTYFRGKAYLRRNPFSVITIGENCVFNSGHRSVPIWLNQRCSITTISKEARIIVGNNVGFTSATLVSATRIEIGNNVMIGADSLIMDTDFHNIEPDKRYTGDPGSKPVIIENGVFLGFKVIVLKGVTIGENSVIGANSVVVSNIPPNSIAMGNPCKVIIRRNWKSMQNVDNSHGNDK